MTAASFGRLGAPRLVFSWNMAYAVLWAYRSLFSVLGEVFVMRFTSIEDTRNYQSQQLVESFSSASQVGNQIDVKMQIYATTITELTGALIGFLVAGNPILVNIGFQTIGFIGLVVFLKAVDEQSRKWLLVLMMLPSFTVWSSIASKEAIIIMLVGVICAHVVRMYNNTDKLRPHHFLVLLVLYMFKPHYLIPVVYVLGISYVARHVRQQTTVAIVAFIATMVMMYIFRDQIDDFARTVDGWLTALGGRSTRPPFLVEPYDVYVKAPYGMFMAFFGPKLTEAANGVLHMLTFIESSFMVGILFMLFIQRLPELPVYNVVLAMGTTFWVMFPNYPLGIFNPGTAVRYRTGYILLIFLAFIVLLPRARRLPWRLRRRRRPVQAPSAAVT